MIDLLKDRFAQSVEANTQGVDRPPASFVGTPGDDHFRGGGEVDGFDLITGGDDTAKGGGGADSFDLGQALTAADRIDGGPNGGHDGRDVVLLDGDYSHRLLLQDRTLSDIEEIRLAGGHRYNLALGGDPTSSGDFYLNNADILRHERIVFDGSRVETTRLHLEGGTGADVLIGGAADDSLAGYYGADTVIGGGGNDDFTAFYQTASISGGDGDDVVSFQGPLGVDNTIDGGAGTDLVGFFSFGPSQIVDLSPERLSNLETFYVVNCKAQIEDGLAEAGNRLLFVAPKGGGPIQLDGSRELHDSITVQGADAPDTLIGGGGDDLLQGGDFNDGLAGGDGGDTLFGGKDNDRLTGGSGSDLLTGGKGDDVFVYAATTDSAPGAADTITDLHGRDTIDLQAIDADVQQAGDQAFQLVAGFSGQAGELTLSYDASSDLTLLEGDVDGDGLADLEIGIRGQHTDFSRFVL